MRDGGLSITGGGPVNRVLKRIVSASIEAVKPSTLFEQGAHLHGQKLDLFGKEINLSDHKEIKCVAVGKSAEAMAYEIERLFGNRISGVIATPIERHFNTKRFKFFRTGHPFPNETSIIAAKEIRTLVSSSNEDDILIFLVSGGGSAAAFLPVDGLSLGEVNQTLKLLFENGVSIDNINLFRRHISLLGGGKLAALAPEAQKISLIISDVVGDDLPSIASGPTVEDSTTPVDAYNFFERSGLLNKIPSSISTALTKLGKEFAPIHVKNNFVKIIASNLDALNAAEKAGVEGGFNTSVVTRFLDLDTKSAARLLVSIARSVELDGKQAPALILLGGETTVKIHGKGKGGRNQQLVLEALYVLGELATKGIPLNRSTVFSFGTDGKDGNSDAAGAYASLATLKSVRGGLSEWIRLGQEIKSYICNNDSNSFFREYGGLITTGPTDTNVMDIMGIIVE